MCRVEFRPRTVSPVHLKRPSHCSQSPPGPLHRAQAQGPQAHLALLCMAADRALDALGVRGASGGPSYCWPPPAAPPHQQVPTWGRPIHEVGAVARRGEEEGLPGGKLTPPSPAFIPSSSSVARAVVGLLQQRRSSLSGLHSSRVDTTPQRASHIRLSSPRASCVLRFSTDSYFNVGTHCKICKFQEPGSKPKVLELNKKSGRSVYRP